MRIKHWIIVALAVACFFIVAFDPTSTSPEEGVEYDIREELRVRFNIQPDAIIVDADEDSVTLDGQVVTQQQLDEIIESVQPHLGGRKLVPKLKVQPTKEIR